MSEVNSKSIQIPANQMFEWATELFPFNRSLTGEGTRQTLHYIKSKIPKLVIKQVKSDKKAFDWTIPKEWHISDGFIIDSTGAKLVDWKENNLHVMGYSTPINTTLTFEELEKHLFTLPSQPDAIPYVTSYYEQNWGFCISESQKQKFKNSPFTVVIKSKLFDGYMNYGELIIPGLSPKTVLLSTNICHPSLANNEVSGPVILTALCKYLQDIGPNYYTYRIIFIPETIGSIYYLSKHMKKLKKSLVAGWAITCVGDDGQFSYIPTRNGNTLTDRVSRLILRNCSQGYKEYSWLDRGSDERQFNSPGIDLPVASITRSKYGEYAEYHTSLDNLDFISGEGLYGSLEVYKHCIQALEQNLIYTPSVLCEPKLGKYKLYETVSIKGSSFSSRKVLNVLSFIDGDTDLLEISSKTGLEFNEVVEIAKILKSHKIIYDINLGNKSRRLKSKFKL
jgi:aminopeptidase-like protein